MRFASNFALTGLAVLGLAGAASASVRVIHASPDAPAVDVYVNGIPGVDPPVFEDLPFTGRTPYAFLPTDNYNFKVTPANMNGPVVIDVNAFIDQTLDYSVVAVNFLASIEPLLLEDDNMLDANNARVRFVHTSPDAPAVDIFAAGVVDPLFDNVAFKESGGYIDVAPGSYDLDVRLDSNGQSVLSLPGVQFDANTVYTIFAMGTVGGNDLQAVTFVDNVIPGPSALALLGAAVVVRRRRRS